MKLIFLIRLIALLMACIGAQLLFTRPISQSLSVSNSSLRLRSNGEEMARKSVVKFGATPNDLIDDTAAIQQAIDNASDSGGGVVYFPKGKYIISVRARAKSHPAIVIRSNVTLKGDGFKKSIIKLAANQGNYDSLFGAQSPTTALRNFSMYDLGIDGNGQRNPVEDERDLKRTRLSRYAIKIYVGDNIQIKRNRFFNQANSNTISVNGEDSVSNVTISDNIFNRVGGGDIDYDHSTIYTLGSDITVSNNIFSSRNGAGTKGARTAIEIHGSNQNVIGNTITGYLYGINSTGEDLREGSSSQLYLNNTIKNVGTGIVLWSSYGSNGIANSQLNPALSNITIQDNQISINIRGWRGFFDNEPRAGITFEPNRNSEIRNVYITENQISFLNQKVGGAKSDYLSSGITLQKYRYPDIPIDGIYISNNIIENASGAGIYFDSVVDQGEISNNQIINSGQSQYNIDDIYRSAIYLTNRVGNLKVNRNFLFDSQTLNTMRYGIVERTNCQGNCFAIGNTLQVMSSAIVPVVSTNPAPIGQLWIVDGNIRQQ